MELLEPFRFRLPIAIRYGDMDTLGHVNNAKYLTYVEQARIRYIRELALWSGGVSEMGLIVARIECDYKLPLTMDDGEAIVYQRVTRMGTKSFDIEFVITRKDASGEAVAAQGKVVLVVYDYNHNTSVTMPEEWRAKIVAYEPALRAK